MRAMRWILVLALVGVGGRATATTGDEAQRCVTIKNRCELTFVVGPTQDTQQSLTLSGVCHMTHVGRLEVTATGVGDLSAGTLSGTVVYVDEHGDELHESFAGLVVPDVVVPTKIWFANVETFAGGTGRFASAVGAGSVSGFADLATGAGALEGQGTLCFDRPDDPNADARRGSR